MKCFNCNREIPDSAKFCNYCGSAQKTANSTAKSICPKCGTPASAGARFCRACGTELQAPATTPEAPKAIVYMTNQHVTWKLLPGQLAVRIDEHELANYKRIKGVYVAPGTTALFFVNGKYAATLDSGTYTFEDYTADEAPQTGPVISFLKKIARHIINGASSLFGNERSNIDMYGNKVFYSVVLVKGSDFPLLYTFQNVSTKNIRSNVGLQMLCRINNLNDFFAHQLSDKKFVAIQAFSDSIEDLVFSCVNQILSAYSPEDVYSKNAEVAAAVQAALQDKIGAVYPYIELKHIINLSSYREDIEKIRVLKEELYVSVQELEQLQARNDFKNRLQNEENRAALMQARSQADLEAMMNDIDKEKMLTQDSRDKFVMMLDAERKLRQAQSETDTNVAINQLLQTDLLSQEELVTLEAQVKQRLAVADLDNKHALAQKIQQNKRDLEDQQLDWAIATDNKQLENQIRLQRTQDQYDYDKQKQADDYADARRDNSFAYDMKVKESAHDFDQKVRNADFDYETKEIERDFDYETKAKERDFDYETKAKERDFDLETQAIKRDFDLEKDKHAQKMEMLAKAEELRRQREAQAHQQEMEKLNAQNAFDLDKTRAQIEYDLDKTREQNAFELDKARVQSEVELAKINAYAGMTAEQIMAANPDVAPEYAKALAEKYKAEAMAANSAETIELLKNQQNEINKVYAQSAQDMKEIALGQMQLSRDIAQMQAGTNAQRLAEKDAEAKRVREDAERHQDRMIDGVKTTVNAVGSVRNTYVSTGAAPAPTVTYCTNCGSAAPSGSAVCPKCGTQMQ